MRIVTFTANPSIDRTAEVPALHRGAVVRAVESHVDAGGKGVNVARALLANGVDALGVLPRGGYEGDKLMALLSAEGIPVRTVPIAHPIRVNLTVVEPDGTTTKINDPGPVLSGDELDALCAALLEASVGADWVVLSGSLPQGAPADLYRRLTDALHATGARVAIDADGPALLAALEAGPDLIKPNRRELAEASGIEVLDPATALAAIGLLRGRGARGVLATMGSGGALLVHDAGASRAATGAVAVRSTVGAGDCTLAGFLAGGGTGEDALRQAVAWGAAAVRLPGSAVPAPADIDLSSVHVHPLTALEAA